MILFLFLLYLVVGAFSVALRVGLFAIDTATLALDLIANAVAERRARNGQVPR